MFNLNEAFDKLRRKVTFSSLNFRWEILINNFFSWKVPTFAYEKRLSRIETLRLAITYISFMTEILSGTPSNHEARSPDIYSSHVTHSHPHIHSGQIQRDFISPYNGHGV